jgi:ABC-type lipoprotein release transport system permease subunit
MNSSLPVGFSALGANPLRTLLSTVGVIIGVASLVAVLSVGDGLERFAREQLETTSIQMIEVAPRTSLTVDGVRVPGTGFPIFELRHAELLTREIAGIYQARLVLAGSARFKAAGCARHRDILGQFLAESVAITAAGSIVGVLLGLGGAFVSPRSSGPRPGPRCTPLLRGGQSPLRSERRCQWDCCSGCTRRCGRDCAGLQRAG